MPMLPDPIIRVGHHLHHHGFGVCIRIRITIDMTTSWYLQDSQKAVRFCVECRRIIAGRVRVIVIITIIIVISIVIRILFGIIIIISITIIIVGR